jgi:hypothetical protein
MWQAGPSNRFASFSIGKKRSERAKSDEQPSGRSTLGKSVEAMTMSVGDRLDARHRLDGSCAILPTPQIVVVQHFDEELKRLVRTK